MRELALAGLAAIGAILLNLIFGASLLGSAWALERAGPAPELGTVILWAGLGIGVTQIVWVLPAIVLTRKRVWLTGGIVIGAAITLLLNGACFGTMCGGVLR